MVPTSESECHRRIHRRLSLSAASDATSWLTLLRAIGLVRRGPAGVVRNAERPDRSTLADRFVETVLGASETVDALAAADAPVARDSLFEPIVDLAPTWERRRTPRWRTEWRSGYDRLLAWLTTIGVVEPVDGGYVLAS
ncbi:MAG: hypothetical protein ACQETB_13585 [Halobacteriota archaeon]